ncbi:MAG: class I SAM-dependent methyltransferase [Clostridia bacterium]|nr:class I SAM-dependent methyltransferase [Clostridia bacterium]
MQKTQLFAAVADFYDYSMRTNCDYSGWANYIVNQIKSTAPNAKSGLDVACGTGYFTRALKNAGYAVTGIDLSPEMLTSAQRITAKQNLFIPYMVGDMTNLKVHKKVDFITVVNDGINCIPTDKLQKVFKSFYSCLNKGGVLHFDVSSEYKLTKIIANNTFCEDDDDYSYIWFNTPYLDRVVMEMSVFLRNGDKYEKKESILTEYIHTIESLKNSLETCGFNLLQIKGELGEQLNELSHRINITAVKN